MRITRSNSNKRKANSPQDEVTAAAPTPTNVAGANAAAEVNGTPSSTPPRDEGAAADQDRPSGLNEKQKKRLLVSVPLRTPSKKKLKPTMASLCTPPQPESTKKSKSAGQPNDLFQKRVEFTLEKATKLVGVISETYSTWLWYVGSRTNTLWRNSQFNTKLDVGAPTTDLPLVEVILLQGSWNSIPKTMREWDELRTVLEITGSQGKLSRGKKPKHSPNLHNGIVPPDWKSGSTWWFFHGKLGGVADGWFLPLAIQTTLHQILSSRAHNNNFAAEPKPQQSNSSKGWLKWSRKRTRISLPHLSRRSMWVSRQLTAKEFRNALDFPSGRVKQIQNKHVLDALINHQTLGKVLAGAVWFLGSDPTQTGLTSTGKEQQNSPPPSVQVLSRTHMSSTPSSYQGVVEVMDFETIFDDKTLKAKTKDCANPILDKATKLGSLLRFKEIEQDGLQACDKADDCSWWTWDKGSAICFWQWPLDYQEIARPPYLDPSINTLVKEKLSVMIDKGNIKLVDIKLNEAMMFMFHVPKGKWTCASFMMAPNQISMTPCRLHGMWLADNDYGKPFLNFQQLHPDLRKYCRVDLSQLLASAPDEPGATGVSMCNAMGLNSSPYNSVQGLLQAKHIVLGDPCGLSNLYMWDQVHLNLQGMESYDPTQPWISKLQSDGLHTAEITQYMNDTQITVPTEDLAWECSGKMAKGLCWLGLQEAARKRRSSSHKPDAWAGTTVFTNSRRVNILDKHTKARYPDLEAKSEKDEKPSVEKIHHKTLKLCVGFLVYVAMTYTLMVPYLKGPYLTLNS
eukprot:jgi/Psemu1/16373/gm1.16373_g